jgi:hypothetical protein
MKGIAQYNRYTSSQASQWGLVCLSGSTFLIYYLQMISWSFMGQILIKFIPFEHYLFAFEVVYGLKVNLAKSVLVLVGTVGNVDALASVLGCGTAS